MTIETTMKSYRILADRGPGTPWWRPTAEELHAMKLTSPWFPANDLPLDAEMCHGHDAVGELRLYRRENRDIAR